MKFISSFDFIELSWIDFHPIRSKPFFQCSLNHRSKSQLRQCAFFGDLAKWNWRKQKSTWQNTRAFGIHACSLPFRDVVSACVQEKRDRLARRDHDCTHISCTRLLRHNPFSQHSSRLLRAPSNALSLQLCAHVTQHCVVAVICVCVCMNEAVVSDLNSAFDC